MVLFYFSPIDERNPNVWFYGHYSEVLHYYGKTSNTEDADVDCGCVSFQEFLHYNGNVSANSLICSRRMHSLWKCQIWREYWTVKTAFLNDYFFY